MKPLCLYHHPCSDGITAAVIVRDALHADNVDMRGVNQVDPLTDVTSRDVFIEETQRAFNGEQTMQAALDNAATRGNQLLRRFEQTYRGVTLP
jgi:ABC-type glycerol-3-phosphate transport system substrate-binding protein